MVCEPPPTLRGVVHATGIVPIFGSPGIDGITGIVGTPGGGFITGISGKRSATGLPGLAGAADSFSSLAGAGSSGSIGIAFPRSGSTPFSGENGFRGVLPGMPKSKKVQNVREKVAGRRHFVFMGSSWLGRLLIHDNVRLAVFLDFFIC